MTSFDKDMIEVLHQAKLPTPNSMTPEIHRLQEQSTTSQPQILTADQCQDPCPTTNRELFLETWDYLNNNTVSVFTKGEEDNSVNPKLAVAQLIEPEQTNPIFLTFVIEDSFPHPSRTKHLHGAL